jgi:hypothetical protein
MFEMSWDQMPQALPGVLTALGYAEIHYKFRLPWSPLFRAEPELIVDAPYMVGRSKKAPLFLVGRDCNRFPVRIVALECDIRKIGGISIIQKIETILEWREPFHYCEWELSLPEEPGEYSVNVRVDWEPLSSRKRGKTRSLINSNLPTLGPMPLLIRRLGHPSPVPSHWKGGDLHLHTTATSSPVEFGGDPAMLQRAAEAIGLDWFACTDHSYDFSYQSDDYRQPCDPQAKRDALLQQLSSLDPGGPLPVYGEEVSCGNVFGENVHLLVLGNREHIEGNGDGGRRWFNNRPELTIPEVIERAQGLPCWAAHPKTKMGLLEKIIFRRGQWHPEDLHPGLTGLQFWNGNTGIDFLMGRAFWVKRLIQGEKWLPGGGTDAHGDLNRSTGVKTPLISLWANRDHRFGSVRSWFPIDGKMDLEALLESMRQGQALVGTGPWLTLQLENSGAIRLIAQSNEDFGAIRRIVIFTTLKGAIAEMAQSIDPSPGTEDLSHFVELRIEPKENARYLRAELHTTQEERAITSPLWLE